jgi:hypothetical protein
MTPNSNITLATIKHYQETHGLKSRNSSIEVAKVLDCNNDTLRKSRSTGYLFGVPAPRHIKIGYTVKYTLEDLVQWLEESNKNESEAA